MPSPTLVSFAAAAALAASGLGCHANAGTADGCTKARIGGRLECLAVGRLCRPHFERIYNSYGYTCKRGPDGRFRLRHRHYIGPPNQ